MPNIHGLKLNKKTLSALCSNELSKPIKEQGQIKVRQWEKEKSNIDSKILELRKKVPSARRSFRRTKKPGQTCKDKPLPIWCS